MSYAGLTVVQRRRLTLLAMCVAQFMILLDVTIVNIALPSIQHELHVSPGNLEWVVSAYALSLAAFIPLGGALGDRFGRKRLFLFGMVVFALGSAACAVSTGDAALIGARAIQGAGGAVMSALTLSILAETYPPRERAGAIGLWAAIGGLGFGAGPVAGGVLLTFFSWSSVFWVNVPIAVVGLAVSAVAVTESGNQLSRRLDVPGVVTSAAGLVGVTVGLIESSSHPWGSWPVAAPLVAGAALLAGFVFWEQHASSPMLPAVLLRSRSFATGFAVYMLAYVAMTGALFYVTLLYQNVDGWSVLRTGLSWLFMNIPYMITAQSAGRLHSRFSNTTVIAAGCLVAAIGTAGLSLLTASAPFVVAAVSYAFLGAGFGASSPAVTHVAMRDVPPGASGAASGVLSASRQVGTSVGLAVLGAIGINAAVSDWTGRIARIPGSVHARAAGQAQNVAGANIAAVTRALGASYRNPAVQSFVHGYRLALLIGSACLLVAAVATVIGLRQPPGPPAPEQPPSEESSRGLGVRSG